MNPDETNNELISQCGCCKLPLPLIDIEPLAEVKEEPTMAQVKVFDRHQGVYDVEMVIVNRYPKTNPQRLCPLCRADILLKASKLFTDMLAPALEVLRIQAETPESRRDDVKLSPR